MLAINSEYKKATSGMRIYIGEILNLIDVIFMDKETRCSKSFTFFIKNAGDSQNYSES
jgi:hypothetical protein